MPSHKLGKTFKAFEAMSMETPPVSSRPMCCSLTTAQESTRLRARHSSSQICVDWRAKLRLPLHVAEQAASFGLLAQHSPNVLKVGKLPEKPTKAFGVGSN